MCRPRRAAARWWHYHREREATNAVVMTMDSTDQTQYPIHVEAKTHDGLRFLLVGNTIRSGGILFHKEDFAPVMSEFGSTDPDFVFPLLHQIGKLGIKDHAWDPEVIKLGVAFIRGSRPRDQISSLLAFHMMSVHQTIMVNFARINQAQVMQYNKEEEGADRAVNRLVQTLVRLTEAYDQHQNGGERKLTVGHMVVTNGQQVGKPAKRPKREINNGNPVINGATNHVEHEGDVLLNKSADVE